MYCNKCGYQLDNSDKFCKKCGNAVSHSELENQTPPTVLEDQPMVQQASGYEAAMQQPLVHHAPVQQASGYQATMTNNSIWGKFGGLMVFVPLIILTFIIGAASSTQFLASDNLSYIGGEIAVLLPIAFAVALTVKHKGLDFSFPAMAALTSAICSMTQTFALGILISLLICIIIGTINAVCIHFLKLPGMLVTISTYLIAMIIFRVLPKDYKMNTLDNAPWLMYAVILIAVIIAVGIALLSSIGKDHRNKLWTTLTVYVGSGIFSALYIIALSLKIRVIYLWYSNWMIPSILLIGAFLCITRFFKSKGMGIVFAIIPSIFIGLIRNVVYLAHIDALYHEIIIQGLVLVLLIVLFYRGRAQLLGHSFDTRFKTKSWIAFIPLLVLFLINIIMLTEFALKTGGQLVVSKIVASVYVDWIILLGTVAICITHALLKPKGSNIV